MNNKIKFAAISAVVLTAACKESKFPGFEQTENGLYYQITATNETGDAIETDDVLSLDLKYWTSTDSVLYDSKEANFPTQIKVGESAYKGDIMEGFAMMKVGESAQLITSADSFFTKIARMDSVPDYIEKGSYLTFEVTVNKAQTIEELQAEKAAEAELMKGQEAGLLSQYIADNGITQEPTESGMYYIELEKGDGPGVERGSTVEVHYEGKLLTGEVFDSSFERGEPIKFTLGAGQVIKGWDEGIGYMTVGTKALLVIPSALAYGQMAPPGSIIKPYSPLVFTVQLISAE